jgi:hypothetical protein
MTALNHADMIFYKGMAADRVYAGSVKVWERFSPLNLTGCKVWLDASKLAVPNGAPVSSWTNLAGSPHPALLGSPSPVMMTNAINTSMPCVRVTQGQGRWRFTGLDLDREYTAFIVARRWQLRGGRILTSLGTTSNFLIGWHGNEFECMYQEGWFNTPGPTGGLLSTTAWRMYSADGSASNTSRLFGFGYLLGQHPTPPASKGWGGTLNISGYTNDVDIAVSQQADCDVAELIVYNRKMPDLERQRVESYLMTKWNPITAFKPTDLGSNLVAWFDAKDAASVQRGTGPSTRGAYYGVYNWKNKGAGAMTLTQYTDAYRPLYTSGVSVNFAQGEIMNPANAPASFDVYVVSRPNLAGDWRTLLRSAQGHEMIIEHNSNRLGVYTTTAFNPAGALEWPGVDGLGFARVAASTATLISRDGGPLTATATALPAGSPAATMFGGYASAPPSQPWGKVYEVIFVPYNLEGARLMIEGYLMHRHGFASLLPSNHPYKINPP